MRAVARNRVPGPTSAAQAPSTPAQSAPRISGLAAARPASSRSVVAGSAAGHATQVALQAGVEAPFWQVTGPDAVQVRVKVQPRARRLGPQGMMAGPDGPCLRLGVAEPPEDGRATLGARTALARALGIAVGAVSVVLGATNRHKILRVEGDAAALTHALERLASPGDAAAKGMKA